MSSKSKNISDRLSSLPQEVLSHILSLMPTIFAVRTSVLSKKWRYIWTSITNLDFTDSHFFRDVSRLSIFVARVLELCQTSQVKLFSLCFSEIWVPESTISWWISEAVRLNVVELDIQVFLMKLPLSLFTCKSLTKLRIVQKSLEWKVWNVSSPVNLPCLKHLEISTYNNPYGGAFKFIHGCPILETLSLELTWMEDEGEYYNINIPTLKRLELITPTCPFKKFVLNVPNLEYLFVDGACSTLPQMKDPSSLVDASLTFPSSSSLPVCPNLKHLELKGGFRPKWFKILHFLESSSELEHLCVEQPGGDRWIEPLSVPTCMITNLRTIKFLECHGGKCDIRFLKYILKNAEVLKTATITCEHLYMKKEMWLCKQLLKVPRASRNSEIQFVGKWCMSSFNV